MMVIVIWRKSTRYELWVRFFNLYLKQNKLEIRNIQESKGILTIRDLDLSY